LNVSPEKSLILSCDTVVANERYHQHNRSIHVTDGLTVSLTASLQHKTSATTFHLCQIASNWILSHKFKKWYSFQVTKSFKKLPACT